MSEYAKILGVTVTKEQNYGHYFRLEGTPLNFVSNHREQLITRVVHTKILGLIDESCVIIPYDKENGDTGFIKISKKTLQNQLNELYKKQWLEYQDHLRFI